VCVCVCVCVFLCVCVCVCVWVCVCVCVCVCVLDVCWTYVYLILNLQSQLRFRDVLRTIERVDELELAPEKAQKTRVRLLVRGVASARPTYQFANQLHAVRLGQLHGTLLLLHKRTAKESEGQPSANIGQHWKHACSPMSSRGSQGLRNATPARRNGGGVVDRGFDLQIEEGLLKSQQLCVHCVFRGQPSPQTNY
jgi:hypothetical protein